ncbi:uncharacterized protein LOC124179731 [Neodiprion fabricii]|uniref:uncharacterized protein LOC124179731 n=1 Tax=Neodiprion fabricii TaxID=2872261 RepID=UPI001ED95582|nr:uncharacterized protein LOC124179731 [Neodiprion fabricii]
MVDLYGADKGNISLPPRLQSPEVHDEETDDSKEVMILNMQTAFYQIRIADILKRIERLQNRNTEIEDSCIAEKLYRSQVDINTANQIAELNRQIYSEVEKLTEQKKRIRMIQDWIVEEKEAHLKNVEYANEKYERTRLEITTKINVLSNIYSKINTLEEYKEAKTDLRNKLIAGNNLIAQREKDVEQRCEQIDRKFKIGREKLKNEMYARLRGLAGTFQIEVATSIAEPIHRLMRENVFLKNELLDVVRESVQKKEKMKENNQTDETKTRDCAVSRKSTVEYLIKSKIQGHLLNTTDSE